ADEFAEKIWCDERAVDREDDRRVVSHGAQTGDDAEDRCPLLRAVVDHGKCKRKGVVGLSDRDDLVTHSTQCSVGTLSERLTAKPRERLRRAETLGSAADEQHSRRG